MKFSSHTCHVSTIFIDFLSPLRSRVTGTRGSPSRAHGAQKLARANEQEKQKQQQQQMARQRQQQQKQAKKRQQPKNGGETRVSTLALKHSGARSTDDAKARTPTVCAQTIL